MSRSLIRGSVLFGLVFAALVVLVLTSREEEAETRRPAAAAPAPVPGALGGIARRIGPAGLGEHLDASHCAQSAT